MDIAFRQNVSAWFRWGQLTCHILEYLCNIHAPTQDPCTDTDTIQWTQIIHTSIHQSINIYMSVNKGKINCMNIEPHTHTDRLIDNHQSRMIDPPASQPTNGTRNQWRKTNKATLCIIWKRYHIIIIIIISNITQKIGEWSPIITSYRFVEIMQP